MIKKFLKLFGIFLLIFFSYNVYSLNGWQYYRQITINNTQNPNNLIDYQILVTLDTQSLISQGKMKSDCGDIRFTDSDRTTLLNYWVESGTCNSQNTFIWVKVPLIPGNSNKTIYLWYGNPNAISLSNGDLVFEFFDDFDGNTLNTSKWTVNGYDGFWGVFYSVSNSMLTIWSDNRWRILRMNRNFGPNDTIAIEVKFRKTAASAWHVNYLVQHNGANHNRLGLSDEHYPGDDMGIQLVVNNNWYYPKNFGSFSNNVWYISRIIKKDSTTLYLDVLTSNRGFINSYETTQSAWSSVIWTWVTWQFHNTNVTYDWVFVRKYTNPEPIIILGSEHVPLTSTISVNTLTNFQFNVSIYNLISEYVNYTVYLNGLILTTNNISINAFQTLTTPHEFPYLLNQSGTYNLTVIAYGQTSRVTSVSIAIFNIQLDQLNVTLEPYYTYNNINYTNLYNSNLRITYYCMRPNNTLIIYNNITNRTLQINLSCNYIQTINNLRVNLTPILQNNTLNHINGSLLYGNQSFRNISFIPLWNTLNITLTTNIPAFSIYTSPLSLNYSINVRDVLPNVVCNITLYDNNTIVQTHQTTLTNASSPIYSWTISQAPIHNLRWHIYCYNPVNLTYIIDQRNGTFYYNSFDFRMEDTGNMPSNISYSLSLMCNNGTTIYSNANMTTYTIYAWTNDQCNFILVSQNIQGITYTMGYSTNLLSRYSHQWPICLINPQLLYYSNLIVGNQPYQDTLIAVLNPQTGCYLLGSYLYLLSSNVYYAPISVRTGALYSIRVNNTFLATVQGQQQQAISLDSLISRVIASNNQTINLIVGYPVVNYTNESGVPKLTIIAPANISSAIVTIYQNNQIYTNYTFESIGLNILDIYLRDLPSNYTFSSTNYVVVKLTYTNGLTHTVTYPFDYLERIALPAFLVYFLSIILLYTWIRTFSYYQKLIFAGFGLVLILALLTSFIIDSIAPLFLTAGIFLFFIADVINKTYLPQLTQDHPLFKLIYMAFKFFMVLSFVGTFLVFLLGPQGLYHIGIPEIDKYMNDMKRIMDSSSSTITEMQRNMFFVPFGIVILAASIIQAIWLGIQIMGVFISYMISPLSVVLGPFANILAMVIQGILVYGSIIVIVVYMITMVFALAGRNLF